jgi:hypothetical protein
MLDDVKVFQEFKGEYEGDLSPLELLRLKYLALVAADPVLEQRIAGLPLGISSAKANEEAGTFLCRRLPTLVRPEEGSDAPPRWAMEPGRIEWTLMREGGDRLGALSVIDEAIECDALTAHAGFSAMPELRTHLREFEREETKRFRKKVQLPLDAPTPQTICWMELR